MLQLTFNPGLTLTSIRTTWPRAMSRQDPRARSNQMVQARADVTSEVRRKRQEYMAEKNSYRLSKCPFLSTVCVMITSITAFELEH